MAEQTYGWQSCLLQQSRGVLQNWETWCAHSVTSQPPPSITRCSCFKGCQMLVIPAQLAAGIYVTENTAMQVFGGAEEPSSLKQYHLRTMWQQLVLALCFIENMPLFTTTLQELIKPMLNILRLRLVQVGTASREAKISMAGDTQPRSLIWLKVHKHILAQSKNSRMFIDYPSICGNNSMFLVLMENTRMLWSTYYVSVSFHTLLLFKSYNNFQDVLFMFMLVTAEQSSKQVNWPMDSSLTLKVLECKCQVLFSIGDKVLHQTLHGSLSGDIRNSTVF